VSAISYLAGLAWRIIVEHQWLAVVALETVGFGIALLTVARVVTKGVL